MVSRGGTFMWRSASRPMAAKIGAAASLPHFSFLGSSSRTIMAMRGSSAGAKPTKDRMPGRARVAPRGRIHLLRGARLARHLVAGNGRVVPGPFAHHRGHDGGELARRLGRDDLADRLRLEARWPRGPARRGRARTICGCMSRPPLATAREGRDDLQRGHRDLLPDGHGGEGEAGPRAGGRSWPRLSPGRPRPGGRAEAEGRDVLVVALLAELSARP